jgi:dienelactone hydrolase
MMTFHIPADDVLLEGDLAIPKNPNGVVVFAQGSVSSRHSARDRYVANFLRTAGLATLLMDLLTIEERTIGEKTAALRFDIDLLARRLTAATWWLFDQSETSNLQIGYIGSGAGAAAALAAAARLGTGRVSAIVSRGGRPDLAGMALHKVIAPTLLIVGQNDPHALAVNRWAYHSMPSEKKLEIVPNATHLFEEPGALQTVAQLAEMWFETYLAAPSQAEAA